MYSNTKLTAVWVFAAMMIPAIYSSEGPLPLPYAASSNAAIAEAPAPSYLHTYNQDGFNVQSGYEGYLVPTIGSEYDIKDLGHPLFGALAAKKFGLLAYIKPVVELAIKLLPKIGLVVVSIGALLLIGTALTTAVCSFTPICHLKFYGWNFSNEDVRGFLSNDRLSEMTSFVRSAIKKYQLLNEEATTTEPPKRVGKVVPITTNEVK